MFWNVLHVLAGIAKYFMEQIVSTQISIKNGKSIDSVQGVRIVVGM